MKQINTRTVRASVLGQALMKQFGKKRGKKLIKSVTVAFRFGECHFSKTQQVIDSFHWAMTPQGHKFWNNVDTQQDLYIQRNK